MVMVTVTGTFGDTAYTFTNLSEIHVAHLAYIYALYACLLKNKSAF